MDFRTQLPIQRQKDNLIDYQSKILFLGSCFSENIGAKFDFYKFQNSINPFGILFHPKAVELFVKRVVNKEFYKEEELIFYNELYHCFDAHSSLSNSNKQVLLQSLNSTLNNTHQYLSKTSHIVITFGTAWIYEHVKRKTPVANCHKIPQRDFNKRILSVQEIITSLVNIEMLLKSINSSIKIIYTVSPVRHIKDGFIENQNSKSNLLSAIHEHLSRNNCSYFPSYEIMIDDLRDYRFYKSDMLHPNEVAVDYIWEYFKKTWLAETTIPIMKRVIKIQKGLLHKPFNSKSLEYVNFLKHIENQKQSLVEEFPFMIF